MRAFFACAGSRAKKPNGQRETVRQAAHFNRAMSIAASQPANKYSVLRKLRESFPCTSEMARDVSVPCASLFCKSVRLPRNRMGISQGTA